MKLRELKCKNCGASIKVPENATQVKCEYCKTSFAVDDAYSDGYKFEKGRMKAQTEHLEKGLENVKGLIKPVGKMFAMPFIVSSIVGVIIFVVAIIMIITIARGQMDNSFNNSFEIKAGTNMGATAGRLIDDIITNNKTNEKHKITLIYKDIETQNPEEMKEIKKELNQWADYEVSFEYDKKGYIYQAKIEE